jgi:hypothetical protein
MKKIFLLLSAALVLGTTFSSCNKKLKDDIEELEAQISTLQSQQNNTNTVIQDAFGAPAVFSFSTKNNNDETISINDTYRFATEYDFIEDNGDGTYDFELYNHQFAYWSNASVYIEGTYNPTTNTVENAYLDISFIDQFGDDLNPEISQDNTENTFNFTISNFNFATGRMDISVNGSTSAASGDNYYSNEPMTFSYSVSGGTYRTVKPNPGGPEVFLKNGK